MFCQVKSARKYSGRWCAIRTLFFHHSTPSSIAIISISFLPQKPRHRDHQELISPCTKLHVLWKKNQHESIPGEVVRRVHFSFIIPLIHQLRPSHLVRWRDIKINCVISYLLHLSTITSRTITSTSEIVETSIFSSARKFFQHYDNINLVQFDFIKKKTYHPL